MWSSGSLPRCCNGSRAAPARPSTSARIVLVCALLVLACAAGCTRTVLVPESSPVRIGPGVKARVYTLEADGWRLGGNRVPIPEGWYLVPPSFVEGEE